jgi:co-chaperonin GroES (HSP10)
MRILKLLSDWVLVRLEPVKERASGVILTENEPVRIGEVLQTGPGRQYVDKFVPMELKVGDRVAFLIGSAETQQGQQLMHHLEEDLRLIRQGDVLLGVEGDVDIKK